MYFKKKIERLLKIDQIENMKIIEKTPENISDRKHEIFKIIKKNKIKKVKKKIGQYNDNK